MHHGYTPEYFAGIDEGSRASAAIVAPIVMEMLKPLSIVDVGCGHGHWAAAFKQVGAQRVLAIDGPYLSRDALAVAPGEFLVADLTQPLELPCRFDLAVSLEVAEHLPESAAEQFVETLTQAAPAVLISAAIPHQGGEDHVNEQWPAYWANLFADRGYCAFDLLRPKIWNEPAVQWWYTQNMLLFASGDALEHLEECGHVALAPEELLPLVHPGNYEHLAWKNLVLEAAIDLATVVPAKSRLVLADDNLFGDFHLPDRTVAPFTEKDNCYAGPPADSVSAIAELKRQIANGARYMAFGWPSFWQLDHYGDFFQLLQNEGSVLLKNDRLVVFELKS